MVKPVVAYCRAHCGFTVAVVGVLGFTLGVVAGVLGNKCCQKRRCSKKFADVEEDFLTEFFADDDDDED